MKASSTILELSVRLQTIIETSQIMQSNILDNNLLRVKKDMDELEHYCELVKEGVDLLAGMAELANIQHKKL